MSHRKSDLGIPCLRKICQSSAKLSGHSCELSSPGHPGRARALYSLGALEPLSRQVDSKRIGQACLSRRGQPQRAAVALADEPTQIQAAPPDLRAHKTRDM